MTEDKGIPIRNVYYMMAYAFRCPDVGEFENMATEQFIHVHDLFAAIIAQSLATQVRRGLHREYDHRTESLRTIRGRVHALGTMADRAARNGHVACTFGELTADNPLNRAVKSVAMLLLRHGKVGEERKASLRRLVPYLSDVADVDPSRIRWADLRLGRSTASYRMLIGTCRLVVEGMLLTTERGERSLASVIREEEYSLLFEHFVLGYYQEECSIAKARAAQVRWALDNEVEEMLPSMRTDITLESGNRVLIIDTKWYGSTTGGMRGGKVHSHNLYQIFSYVKNRDAGFGDEPHEVAGMLLYARTRQRLQPDVTYQMSGNAISVTTLDMGAEFPQIAAKLDDLVGEFFGGDGPIS